MFARLMFAVPLLLIATPALAQKEGGAPPPQRVRSVVLYGEEQCPKSTDPDEIVVCAQGGDSPYRIPKELRDQPNESAAAQSWTRRTETVTEVNRAVLPGSCSPIGSYGQSGCSQAMIREWYRERADQRRKAGRVP
ncbi:hypothetical protein OF829_10415 [Sphingomonas sp. LB-2]|uniref:hypothetical protein n=1 Tax=Sphingomonas caeni TaxID=2984949 RepID=UPI00223170E2|nr:hypothetical protein [Sphingomonas caeni]MCW3847657.1 hypothetical protein [Sphingomonas caeni]